MSQENVEASDRIVRAINRGDVEEVVRHSTEDFVMIAGRSAVEGSFVGHEGIRKFFADNAENFELFQLHVDDVQDLGDERVLSIGTIHVRGRRGGVETDTPFAGVTTFRDGKVSRWEDFRERRRALEAVGLSE